MGITLFKPSAKHANSNNARNHHVASTITHFPHANNAALAVSFSQLEHKIAVEIKILKDRSTTLDEASLKSAQFLYHLFSTDGVKAPLINHYPQSDTVALMYVLRFIIKASKTEALTYQRIAQVFQQVTAKELPLCDTFLTILHQAQDDLINDESKDHPFSYRINRAQIIFQIVNDQLRATQLSSNENTNSQPSPALKPTPCPTKIKEELLSMFNICNITPGL